MFNLPLLINNGIAFASNMIQKEPMILVKPILFILGHIMNLFFNIAYFFTEHHSLGISIILLTIITRILMLPLAVKSQKSMSAMQALQPEMEKIRAKYGDSKDPEVQQKMNLEIQQLYSKNKVSPFGGCLPMLVQFPIFIALSYIMQQSYLFITKLGAIYQQLAQLILKVPEKNALLFPYVYPKLPKGLDVNLDIAQDVMKVLNKFTPVEWVEFISKIPSDIAAAIEPVLLQKQSIEYFAGIDLLGNAGWAFPGILIPLLSAVFTFLSSYLTTRTQKSNDPSMKTQQRVMMIVMPIMIFFMTVGFPAGVGLYWVVSNVFQLFQQLVLDKKYKAQPVADKNVVKTVTEDKPKSRKDRRK